MLLFKSKKDYYLRKNAWKYLNADVYGIVDDNNNVTHYIIRDGNPLYIASEQYRGILYNEIKNRFKSEHDRVFIYCLKNKHNLLNPVPVNIVRGIRYASLEEKNQIHLEIMNTIFHDNKITFKDKLYNSSKWREVYTFAMENNLDAGLFHEDLKYYEDYG